MPVTNVCLGCGAVYSDNCAECYKRLQRCTDVFGHWPMETSLSPEAARWIASQVENFVDLESEHTDQSLSNRAQHELVNLENNIRAWLQHVARSGAFSQEPTDEELLA